MKKTATIPGIVAALGMALICDSSSAQSKPATPAAWPTRSITIVVPYAPGGVADATGRLMGQKLQEALHQPVVIENRVGAGGMIGAGSVARGPADGYTLLLGVSGLVLQPYLVEKASYDPFKDFAPITLIARLPLLLAVPRTGPAQSLDEFVALAKSDPARLNIGNYGIGTPSHLLGIMFNQQSGTDLTLIPFQGSSALAANLLSGQIAAGLIDSVTARQFADKLNFLGVTGTQRLATLPDLPTFREKGLKSFEQDGWLGILVATATPPEIVARLSSELERIIKTPDVARRIEAMGIAPVGSTPAEYAKVMRTDSEVYGRVIKQYDIRAN